MKNPLLMLALTLTACHASCGETSGPGPDPVAQAADAAAPTPSLQPFNKRSIQRRPGFRTVTPVEQNQGED